MVLVALLLGLVFVAVRVLFGPEADPRATWAVQGGVPVWFEQPASGARYLAEGGSGKIVVGSAGDCVVPGTRPGHAIVRVFDRERVDIGPIGAAPVRVGGRRLRRPALLAEGDRIVLGGVELVAHIGWLPDPADPRIGTVVAGEQLWARRGPGRYATAKHVIQLLEPAVDPVAYEARARATQASIRALPIVRVQADAIVVDGLAGAACDERLTPEAFVTVCGLLAPLHAGGVGHGGLADGVVAFPGELRLWPVAPTGEVAGDVEALRRRRPVDWPALAGDDVRALALAALQYGVAEGAFAAWTLEPCVRCHRPFARAEPPRTTMFDGRDRETGRSFGGRTTELRSECLACGHIEVRVEREAYR